MKRLMKTLGAQLGSVLLLAAAASAQGSGAAPVPPQDMIIAGTGAAGVGGFGGGMAPAAAEIRIVNAGAGIPVGGGLLIYSGSGSSAAPIVEVTDTADPTATLDGSLKQVANPYYWVWVPSIPLTVDSLYQVQATDPHLSFEGATATFKAVAEITIARPAISADPSASWRGETYTVACCSSLIGGILQQASCFPDQQRASITLEPGFITSDPAVLLNQFLFRLGNDEVPSASAFPGIWPNVTMSPIYTQAEEYCFELQAIEILTGMVFTYEDIEHCAPHGELADLGVIEIEPGSAELDRLVCHAPPDKYQDQWCDLNEDPCADDDMATACGLYGFVCEGEPLPPDPFSGFGGFGDTGGTGATSGDAGGEGGIAGMSEQAGEGGDDDSSGSGSDCSVRRVRAADDAAGGMVALTALGLALLARRRVVSRRTRVYRGTSCRRGTRRARRGSSTRRRQG